MTVWATAEQARALVTVPAAVDDTQLGAALDAASALLAGLSGRDAPVTTTVVPEPCGCLLTGPYDRRDTGAAGQAGGSPFWWRTSSGLVLADGACGCDLRLPDNPVLSVLQLVSGGRLIDPAAYVLLDSRWLRRTVGSWGVTTQVTYTTGSGIGPAGQLAAVTLAVELARAAVGDRGCQLPSRVTTLVRQGVTMTLIDPQAFLTGGMTGLTVVDLWLASTRQPSRRVSVMTPEMLTYRHRPPTPQETAP